MSENFYKYKTRATKRFKKHAKLIKKRSVKDSEKLKDAIEILAKGEKLPERFRDHELTGSLKGNRGWPYSARFAFDLQDFQRHSDS